MQVGRDNVGRLNPSWGDSLMNKLPSLSRKRRKRDASKKRRVQAKKEQRGE